MRASFSVGRSTLLGVEIARGLPCDVSHVQNAGLGNWHIARENVKEGCTCLPDSQQNRDVVSPILGPFSVYRVEADCFSSSPSECTHKSRINQSINQEVFAWISYARVDNFS